MEKLPADLLDRPAPEGARWIALARLHQLTLERKRLDDPGDAEALHDFRVALRRLRSVIRAYRSVLDDSITRGMRRRLSCVAHAAGVSRDAQVRLSWIVARRDTIAETDLPAISWVERQLRRERRTSDRKLLRELDRDFVELTERLGRRLMRYRVALAPGRTRALPSMRELVARTLAQRARELEEALAIPRKASDVRELHRARIAAKRLRYALEPLAEGRCAPPALARRTRAAVTGLTQLQDELGRINDAHLFARWLRERTAGDSPALAALRSRLRGVRQALAAEAEASYQAISRPEGRRRVQRMLRSVGDLPNAMVSPHSRDVFLAAPVRPPSRRTTRERHAPSRTPS